MFTSRYSYSVVLLSIEMVCSLYTNIMRLKLIVLTLNLFFQFFSVAFFLTLFVLKQVSVEFAGLHDTPGRMQEKGVITVSLFFLFLHIIFTYNWSFLPWSFVLFVTNQIVVWHCSRNLSCDNLSTNQLAVLNWRTAFSHAVTVFNRAPNVFCFEPDLEFDCLGY